MIREVHSGSRIRIFSIPDPGVKKAPDPRSATLQSHRYGKSIYGTPTKRQVSKRPVSKRLKRQLYKTTALQNVMFTKCQVYKTSGLQNVRLKKNFHIYSVLVVGGNPQVLLQPCLQAKGWPCFILYFRDFFGIYHHKG